MGTMGVNLTILNHIFNLKIYIKFIRGCQRGLIT